MSKRPTGWAVGGVSWFDVWIWAADLLDDFGYWTTVKISPPLPSLAKLAFDLVVECKKLSGQESQEHIITKHLAVGRNARTTPEAVALQLLTAVYMDLDRKRYDAERAAGEGQLPF